MKRIIYLLLVVLLWTMTILNMVGQKGFAQEYLVVFAANLESTGGVNREDPSGADLWSVRFNPESKTVSDLTRLTADQDASEWFPALSPDTRWVAYDYAQGMQHEVRIMNRVTGEEIAVFDGGRFPEWIDNNKLLVASSIPGQKDIFLIHMNMSGSVPQIIQVEQITDRTRCPDTSMGGDPFPFPGEPAIAFHVLRASGESGAAMARINSDGTGYQRLTDWDGSGHSIVNSSGDEIICSVSGTGQPRVLFLDDQITAKTLSLPLEASEMETFDQRFSNTPKIHHSYVAWGDHDHALFLSTHGSTMDNSFSFCRLFYGEFDENWENPELFDFSSAIEDLSGMTGKDFCTASARIIPPETGIVYVCLFMHNEDPYHAHYPDFELDENQTAYVDSRNALLSFCEMLNSYNVPFNWQTDWNFLYGVFKWDTPYVTTNTSGKNIVRYIYEDLNITVDPHSHENWGHNYTDVAHLIDSLGVPPTAVIGGHVWDPNDSHYQNWERFQQPLRGQKYRHVYWKGDILMGHATAQHVNDPEPSGVWNPQGKFSFFNHDPAGTVSAVGQYESSVKGVRELIDLYKNGTVAPSQILTTTIGNNQFQLENGYNGWYEQNIILPLLDMQNQGDIQIVTFKELIDIWKTQYNSDPHIFNAPSGTNVTQTSGFPSEYRLEQNSPNPFNPVTSIGFSLKEPGHVLLKVFDICGREMLILVDRHFQPGYHRVLFHAQSFPSGVYLYQILTKEFTTTKKMLLLE